MHYWLFMFRPDTYEKVQQHQTVGVREQVRRHFSEVKKGDRFVVYVVGSVKSGTEVPEILAL